MSSDFSAGDLNRGNLVVRLVTFGIPLALGMFFHSLFGLVDLIIVGKLGAAQLAAVNTASFPPGPSDTTLCVLTSYPRLP